MQVQLKLIIFTPHRVDVGAELDEEHFQRLHSGFFFLITTISHPSSSVVIDTAFPDEKIYFQNSSPCSKGKIKRRNKITKGSCKITENPCKIMNVIEYLKKIKMLRKEGKPRPTVHVC